MILRRSLVPLALMSLGIAASAGCKDDPPPPTAEPTSSAEAANQTRQQPMRNPPAPVPKIEPQAMKEYRVDVCYFGTLTLKQARDAYFASLGKDEPSEKKIPSFGVPQASSPAGAAAPATTGTPASAKPGDKAAKPASPTAPGAKPASPTAPGAKPTAAAKTTPPAVKPPAAAPVAPKSTGEAAASKAPAEAPKTAAGTPATPTKPGAPPQAGAGATADMRPDIRRPFDISMRAPHDRNARACTVAAGLKDFAMPNVDEALAAFAPFAVDLARDINAANQYYQREEYKKDNFEKGKDFHKKLVAGFDKLDDLSDKLGAAIEEWRKSHPPDQEKLDPGQKLALAAFNDAREVLRGVLPKKIDTGAFKGNVAKLEKSIEALKAHGTANANDPWPKFLGPSLDAFLKTAKESEGKVSEKGVQQDTFLNIITGYTSVIEANYRALSRALIAKGQTMEPRMRPVIPPPGQMPGAPAERKAPERAAPEKAAE